MKLSSLKVIRSGEQHPLPPLWTKHIDQGKSEVLYDSTGKIIYSEDAKEAKAITSFDTFNRPTHGWTKNNASDSWRLISYSTYGEAASSPSTDNLLGQLWQQYDESGKIQMDAFDFKGNLLSKSQQVISSATLKTSLDNYETYLVDWTGLPSILDSNAFITDNEYDALNRSTKITLPEDVDANRKEIVPTYNRAGALEKVNYDSTEYVSNIVYNAKGQRLLVAFGNNVMTRYAYDNLTFRLKRMQSQKFTYSQVGDTHTYTVSAGTKRQDDAFDFDLVGNIVKKLIRVNDCGINGSTLGSDAIDRSFEYDPLYRVISGDGRESDTQNQNDYLYTDAPAPGSPNANNVRSYKRQYQYDKIGNVEQVKQLGTNGFTRNFIYNTGVNTLQEIEDGSSTTIQSFTYDAVGNQITAGSNRNYVWNAANQLITYYNQAGGSDPTIFAQYDYNGGGERISKLVRTGTTGSPIYERTIYIDGVFEYHILENGTTYEKNYVHIMDDKSRIAMVRIGEQFPDDISDAITYNLEDQIGSSTVRLDTSGGVIDKEEYYPFGDSSLRTYSKKRYRYVGKEKDIESGLHYYGARYYAAWTCRFISVDPLANDYLHLTPYNNAGNKVINTTDIDGMQGSGDNVTNPNKSKNKNIEKEEGDETIEEGSSSVSSEDNDSDTLDITTGGDDKREKDQKETIVWEPKHKIRKYNKVQAGKKRGYFYVVKVQTHKERWVKVKVLEEGTVKVPAGKDEGEQVTGQETRNNPDNKTFNISLKDKQKIEIEGYNQATITTDERVMKTNQKLGGTHLGGYDGTEKHPRYKHFRSGGKAQIQIEFLIQPNFTPPANGEMKYKITLYRREKYWTKGYYKIKYHPGAKAADVNSRPAKKYRKNKHRFK